MGLIKKIFRKIKCKSLINQCYNQMERQGIATFGMCGGIKNSRGCNKCPYYVGIETHK